jgi:hypothetical protein
VRQGQWRKEETGEEVMGKSKIAAIALALALTIFALGAIAQAEVVQKGDVRVTFKGDLTPNSLPRTSLAPVKVSVAAKITPIGDSEPQLRKMSIAINRNGVIDTKGLPVCSIDDIQPATTADALGVCRKSLVGEGIFTADVPESGRSPFPSEGKLYAFNGEVDGKPAILAHVYGVRPAPTSFTLDFLISRSKGTYGTTLEVSLPKVKGEGFITGISLDLSKTFKFKGKQHSFSAGSCPAPKGVNVAGFPFAKASFAFADGKKLETTLNRSCRVRG